MDRFFDILLSILALLIFSPLLVPVFIILRLSGEGEIFFYKTGSAGMVRFSA